MRVVLCTICAWWLLMGMVLAQPTGFPKTDLEKINEAVDHIGRILDGRPHPMDLTKIAWGCIKREAKITQDPDLLDVYYASEDDLQNRFTLALIEFDGPSASVFTYHCEYNDARGCWQRSAQPDVLLNRDRLWAEWDFWSRSEAAYPPTSDERLTRQLWGILLGLSDKEAWRIQPQPLYKNVFDGSTGKRIFTDPIRPNPPRTKQYIQQLSRSLRSKTNTKIGAVQYRDNSVTLYVPVTDQGIPGVGLFLFRNKGGKLYLVDWDVEVERTELAIARLCTVSISIPHAAARGGAGTTVRLPELGGKPIAQLVTRLFQLGALNNRSEVLSYLNPSITQSAKLEWWSMFSQSASSLKQLSDITLTALPNGQIVAEFPTSTGRRAVQCSLPSPNRLSIVAINVAQPSSGRVLPRKTIIRNSLEDQVRNLVNSATVAGKQGNALAFFPKRRDFSYQETNQSVVRWSRTESGKYVGSRLLTFDDHTAALILEEQCANRQYRIIAFYVDYQLMKLYNFDIYPKYGNYSRVDADEFLKNPVFP